MVQDRPAGGQEQDNGRRASLLLPDPRGGHSLCYWFARCLPEPDLGVERAIAKQALCCPQELRLVRGPLAASLAQAPGCTFLLCSFMSIQIHKANQPDPHWVAPGLSPRPVPLVSVPDFEPKQPQMPQASSSMRATCLCILAGN